MQQCYDIAPPKVKRYLETEIEFVMDRIKPHDSVLELGCGYGRVLQKLVEKAKTVVGIDTSHDSLLLAQEMNVGNRCYHLFEMNAVALGFRDQQFDRVICIQNGISAFKVDQRKLIEESIRVTALGGTVLLSSYSERFWEERLEWFKIQSEHGLIGEIDYEATGNGVIVCKDGFRATTVGPDDFISLASNFESVAKITEVDGSSVFCELMAN
ncbi:MAG: class I SAM-dependent methyltransferase [bacterium]